jgi:CheY-like chemotaxis protein
MMPLPRARDILAKQSLLVADADPRSLRILEVALRKAGFSVATAVDGAEALRRIQRSAPDMVVCDAALPGQDGLSLCRAVRADARIAGMPILVVSPDKSPSQKARAIEAGADDFLAKPLLIKELVGRVRLLLEQREEQRNAQRESPAALTGALGELGLVDLFQSLDNWKKSAMVSCESEGRAATVWVRDGQVIDAEVLPLGGEAAFYRVLNWDTGSFRVEFGAVAREGLIELGTAGLLMEAMRRVDELGRVTDLLPLDTVLGVEVAVLAQKLGELPDEVNGVLKLFDAKRSLGEALDGSPLDDLSTLAVVQRLLVDGVLRNPKARLPAPKPSLQQWLSAAPVSAPPPERTGFVFSPDDQRPVVQAEAQPATLAAVLAADGAASADSAPESAPAESAPDDAAPSAVLGDLSPAASVEADEPPAHDEGAGQAELAADLLQNLADAEAVEEQRGRDEEERTAPAFAERQPAPVTTLALVRFPPLRGVRRERLRREADEARAQVAAGGVLRLSRIVELPACQPGGADALSSAVRRMSPAVGEAARKFAPDLPVAALQGLRAAAAPVPLSEIDTDPGFRAVPVSGFKALPAASAAPASPHQPAVAPAAAPEPVAAAPSAVAAQSAASSAAQSAAASFAAASAAAESGARAEVDSGAPAAAAATADAPALLAIALPQPPPLLAAADSDSAAQPQQAEPVSAAAPALRAAVLLPASPAPSGTSEADDFEADLRAALGHRRRRWPWVAGAAAAVAALALLLRPQPATDKKDSPWLQGGAEQQPVARAEKPAPQQAAVAPGAALAPAAPASAAGSVAPSAPVAAQPAAPSAAASSPAAVSLSAAPAAAPAAVPEKPAAAAAAPAPRAHEPAPIAVASASLVPPPETDGYAKALDTGEKLLKRGRYRQAVTEFKLAVQHNPESVPALLALGDAFLEADAPRNALKPLQKAAALDPRSGRAQLLLGTAWQSLGKNPDAVKAYQRYLALEPSGEFSRDVRSILANLAP